MILQFFADGTGGTSAVGASGNATGTQTGANQSQDAAGGRANKNPLANVVYGKQKENPDAGGSDDVTINSDTSTKTPFEELIKGEYKEDFDKYFQERFNARFKAQKQEQDIIRSQNEEMGNIIDMLSAKYGIDAHDSKALQKAIEDDNSYFEKEAEQKGMTVEQLKNFRKMEFENSKLVRQMQEHKQQEEIRRNMEEWGRQAEAVKAIYPNFDFSVETQNPEFRALITRNVPVQTAYEVIHKDEIIGGAMQYTAQQVAQKVSNNIRQRSNRPVENGMAAGSGITTKTDVRSLTKADREEIARRAARGERITF